MDSRASLASLLSDLAEKSPAGFAIALHITFTTPRFLFQSYPTKWVDYYTAHGLVLHDPAVRWGFENTGWIRWRDQEDDDYHGVIEQIRRHGMTHGFSAATFSGKSRTIAAFSRADRDFLDFEIDEIMRCLSVLHRETLKLQALSSADIAALKKMSIRLTHA